MLVLKDVLRPRLKPGSSVGGGRGKSSNQTSTLQTETILYPSLPRLKMGLPGLFFFIFVIFNTVDCK